MSRESEAARERRRQHERELERVGIGTDEGQALLDRYWQETRASLSSVPRKVAREEGEDTD